MSSLLYFEPGITPYNWYKVIDALKILYPRLKWQSGKSLDTFNPFEIGEPQYRGEASPINGLILPITNAGGLNYGRFKNHKDFIDTAGNYSGYFGNPVVDGWEHLGLNQDISFVFESTNKKKVEHVDHFFKTGKLLDGTYYFEPALNDGEVRQLYSLLQNIDRSKIILNPIEYSSNGTLLWLDVIHNSIAGWQDVSSDEDSKGEYAIDSLVGIKRWCYKGRGFSHRNCIKPFRNGRELLNYLPNTEDIFNQLDEAVKVNTPEDYVKHFYDTGTLLRGVYYFDPPLGKTEIRVLHEIIDDSTVKNSSRILSPLNHSGDDSLVFIEVNNNTVNGWQNVDTSVTNDGESFIIKGVDNIRKFCDEWTPNETLYDGRAFLPRLFDMEDVFNQITESEEDEFDWVDTSMSNLSGNGLFGVIEHLFKKYDSGYKIEYDGDSPKPIEINDDTGIYYSFSMDDFTIDNLINNLTRTLSRSTIDSDIREEYGRLAKVLEPIIGPINTEI